MVAVHEPTPSENRMVDLSGGRRRMTEDGSKAQDSAFKIGSV